VEVVENLENVLLTLIVLTRLFVRTQNAGILVNLLKFAERILFAKRLVIQCLVDVLLKLKETQKFHVILLNAQKIVNVTLESLVQTLSALILAHSLTRVVKMQFVLLKTM
jgi:hypothetical protein